MTWYAVLTVIVKLLYSFATYVREKELLTAGQAIAVAEGFRKAADALAIANRVDVEADIKHQDPTDGAFDPDFQRPEP